MFDTPMFKGVFKGGGGGSGGSIDFFRKVKETR